MFVPSDSFDVMATFFMIIKLFLSILQVYVNYVNLIVNLIIPTLVLGVLNCMIYRALQNSMTANNIRRNRGGEGSEEALRKRDIRLTRVAIIIVCIFITCHLPRFVPNVVEMFMSTLPEVRKAKLSESLSFSKSFIIPA